ncbi:MAG: phage tail assembly chaperone [Parvularculaceae bacterium]
MIPWRFWLAHAVTGLGLDPDAFWRLTLAEWRWLTAPARADALSRDRLDALLALYPDEIP